MSYSFVRLYLPKCVVCVLNYMFDQTKKILIILSVFGSDFYHSLCSCFVLTLFFIILKFKHVLYWKTGVRVFRDLFATRSWFASHEIGKMIFFFFCIFCNSLATRENLCDSLTTRENLHDSSRDSPVTKFVDREFIQQLSRLPYDLLATCENFRDSLVMKCPEIAF